MRRQPKALQYIFGEWAGGPVLSPESLQVELVHSGTGTILLCFPHSEIELVHLSVLCGLTVFIIATLQ